MFALCCQRCPATNEHYCSEFIDPHVGIALFMSNITGLMWNLQFLSNTLCFSSGVKVGMVNTKVVGWACTAQTFPFCVSTIHALEGINNPSN